MGLLSKQLKYETISIVWHINNKFESKILNTGFGTYIHIKKILDALLDETENKVNFLLQALLNKTSIYTANEGPVRIQYKCLVPIYVFPEMKLLFPKQNYVLSPAVTTLIYLGEICTYCEGYRRPSSKQRFFFFFTKRYEK